MPNDPLKKLKARRFEELRAAEPSRSVSEITAQIEREFQHMPTLAPAAESTAVMPRPESPTPTRQPLSFGERVAGGARSALQGLTLQNWDEIEAGINAAIDPNLTYRQLRDAVREQEGEFRAENPGTAFGLEIGGAVLPAAAALVTGTAPAMAPRAMPLLGRIAQGTAAGAGFGAAQGVGAAKEARDIPMGALTGGGIGAAFGGTLPVAGRVLGAFGTGAGNFAESAIRGSATGTGLTARAAQAALPWAERRAERLAQESLLRRLAEDQVTPAAAAERLQAMTGRGTPAAIADVGGTNVLELANRPMTIGGQGREIMARLGTERVAGSGERLATAAERASGTRMGNVNQMVREIADRRRAPAAELYNRAFAHGDVTLGDRATDIVLTTDGMRAWREGLRRSILDASPGSRPRLQPLFEEVVDNGERQIALIRNPTVRDVDYIKRGFDASIDAAERAQDADLVRVLTKARNDLLKEVDAQVPAYGEARAFWGGEEGLINAMRAGQKVLRGSADDFEDVIAGLNPDELRMYRTGAVNAIREQLERRDGSVQAARFMSDPTVLRRLERLFPDADSFKMLRDVVNDETLIARLDKRLRNQSATARNLMEVADEMAGAQAGGSRGGGFSLLELAGRGLGTVRDAATGEARMSSSDALARLLSQRGQTGVQTLQALDEISRGVLARDRARRGATSRTAGYIGGATVRGTNR